MRSLWKIPFVLLVMVGLPGPALASTAQANQDARIHQPGPPSAKAEAIYASSKAALVQVRTLVGATGQQSAIGSGFLVNADGLIVTNYHVVSQYALKPDTFRLQYVRTDGTRGSLTLVAIDVINDLALVRMPGHGLAHLELDPEAVAGRLARGERAYSMGYPMDIGFTIVEGTWNSRIASSYTPRILFTGAINPGMSGGPTVTNTGKVAGVNVAKRIDGDLVSFLVPASSVASLLQRTDPDQPLRPQAVKAEITRQLKSWQDQFHTDLFKQKLRTVSFGPYRARGSKASWFHCWGKTNSDDTPPPRSVYNATFCRMNHRLFVSDKIGTGYFAYRYYWMRGNKLNAVQFANQLGDRRQALIKSADPGNDRRTGPSCTESFVRTDPEAAPVLHVTWCARAYLDFSGLYDVQVTAVTQDRGHEALVSHLRMHGFSYATASDIARRFLQGITWKP